MRVGMGEPTGTLTTDRVSHPNRETHMSRTFHTYTFSLENVERVGDDGKPAVYSRSKLAESSATRTRMLQAYVPRFVLVNGKAVEVNVRNATFSVEADVDITNDKLKLASADDIEAALAPKPKRPVTARKPKPKPETTMTVEDKLSPEGKAILAAIMEALS